MRLCGVVPARRLSVPKDAIAGE